MAATSMYLVDLQLQRAKMTNGPSCWALKSTAVFVLRTSFPLASPTLSMADRPRQARSCETEFHWWPALVQELPYQEVLSNFPETTGQSRMLSFLSSFGIRYVSWDQTCILVWWLSLFSHALPPFSHISVSPNKILAYLILYWHLLPRGHGLTQKLLTNFLIY